MHHFLEGLTTCLLAVCGVVAHDFVPVVGTLAVVLAFINGVIQLHGTWKGRH